MVALATIATHGFCCPPISPFTWGFAAYSV